MDVGCGNGLLLPKLEAFGRVWGLEVDRAVIDRDNNYRERIYTQPLGSGIYRDKHFDLITALDVIEHIQDDHHAARNMVDMLNPGGWLLVTVPALSVLWDAHDVINQHYRRYTADSLRRLLTPYGRVHRVRYLFHGLVPPKLAVKAINTFRDHKMPQHRMPHPLVNRMMELACRWEHRLLGPLRLPFGTSVTALLQKPIQTQQARTLPSGRTTTYRAAA